MEWFRWWHGTVVDPKFKWIAHKSGCNTAIVIAVWAALLEHASSVTQCNARNADVTRGNIDGFCCEDFDLQFDLKEGQTAQILDNMKAKNLIINNRIVNWEKRQPKREDPSLERVRAYRERQRNKANKTNVTQCNARNADVTQCNSPDTDTDTDTDNNITIPHSDQKITRRTRHDDDWIDPSFEQFWGHYPRKVGKAKVRQIFFKLAKKGGVELIRKILEGLAAQLPAMKSQETQYQPHPATWLTQGRWDDEINEQQLGDRW